MRRYVDLRVGRIFRQASSIEKLRLSRPFQRPETGQDVMTSSPQLPPNLMPAIFDRMHEGILSLMQMAKVSAALARYDEKGGLFISVLTNPTMGGVAASFASLGDVVFAEPKALIGFAGPRTIKATIRIELPEGFQTSEFLLEHGFVDRIVQRSKLKTEIARTIDYCGK